MAAMLLDTFYKILSVDEHEGVSPTGVPLRQVRMELLVDPSHPIFSGHFPGNPVVPGVCQVQMITESVERITGARLKIKEADNVKFLSMINPKEVTRIILEMSIKPLSDGVYPVQATLGAGDQTFLKMKGLYIAREV
jgi:3-hydroxyacyl-[acyl-carrier-protein] dehydratase